ncbi:flagellar assembly protein FliH [Onishia taeanensis]|uniref:Flagellar assembly protein FliH n=1 Tax=Onishia taeanensis TaxID=284577 RepID=A0A328Y330_9GAMM|nr:flagellar assembly protein FliH [Halomonas taeanensis]RAR64601.1 flagellar assembly protein FliH [Halomonas taeanensis]
MSDPDGRWNDQWRPWQMDELKERARSAPAARPADLERQARIRRRAQEHQAALEAERQRIHDEARDKGYQDGFEAGRKEGHEEGLKQGRAKGEEELRQKTQDTIAPLQPLAARFGEAIAQLDDEIADALVNLAIATGRQLAGDALKASPEQILDIVRELIHVEPALSGKPRLWLHPEDMTIVEEQLGHEIESAGWQLQPDDQLSRGGCRVTSQSGELDASWESRFEAISDQVRHRLPAHSAVSQEQEQEQEQDQETEA